MSDGKKLVAAIIETGSVETLRLVSDDLFQDAELVLFRFVRTHFRRYGELPSIATVEQETGQRLPRYDEPVAYYVKKVFDRKLFIALREGFSTLRDALQSQDVDGARDIVNSMRSECRVSTPDNDLRNFFEAAGMVMSQYDTHHLNPGITGVPTGWPSIDEDTGGYQNGDLVAWVARMGVGKTYLLLRQALHAWNNGYSVLLVSMEMPIQQIAMRAMGMEAGINPDYIRKGSLCEFSDRRLRRYVDNMVQADRFNIYSGSFSKKVGDVETLIQELSPDIVFIDGAYIINPDNVGRNAAKHEKVADVYGSLKRISITANRPVITTTQFNKGAGKRGKDGSLETMAFSDAIAMNSSLVYGIKEGLPPHQVTRRLIETLKGREGESTTISVNYRFEPIDFSEMPMAPGTVVVDETNLDFMA